MAARSITGRSAACRSSSVAAAVTRLLDRVGELAVGAVLEPLLALGRGLAEQRLEIDRRRRALLLLGLDRHRAAGRGLEPEAHHRLVDRADLLHVERAVGDALAVEDEQLLERAVDRAVGHERRLDALVDLARAAGGAALEEREAVGVEEDAVALGQPHRARLGAVVDHAEEDEELRPGAVALVHRVRDRARRPRAGARRGPASE